MRRKITFGTMGLLVLLAAATVTWGQQDPPQGPGPAQSDHRMGDGPQRRGDGGPRRFEGGRAGGFGQRGMGWQRGGMRQGMRGGRRGFGGGGGLARLAENPRVRTALGLSDEQVARLHGIGVEAEKGSVQNRADMQLRRIELRELMRADNPNHDAIMQKLDEVNALQGKMAKQRVETMLSAKSVLTADQQKKLKTFMENRGAGGGPEGQRMMPGRGALGRGRPSGLVGAPGGPTVNPQTPPQAQ